MPAHPPWSWLRQYRAQLFITVAGLVGLAWALYAANSHSPWPLFSYLVVGAVYWLLAYRMLHPIVFVLCLVAGWLWPVMLLLVAAGAWMQPEPYARVLELIKERPTTKK